MKNPLAIAVLLAALAFAASPLIFQNFAGYDPGQFPVPQDDPPVQPAGWAFSIWGLIYVWLIAGAAFGLWRRPDDDHWRAMRPPLLASLSVGVFWLWVAARAPVWATVLILLMLVFALTAFLRAGRDDPLWQIRPVALYAGWLTAASGVSAGIVLGGYGIVSAPWAAVLCLAGVTVIALAVQRMKPGEWAYSAAVIWALLGVIAANLSPFNIVIVLIAVMGSVLLAAHGILGATRS
ncbi:tryptophan-rich sensory protein [Paracoccus stylophorae]|uniref:Tryptophan-rich sensory protein n=1 Tax=Paracoccus stylophorae TaxID=659350 RepID=A0ABY7SUY5_9RHOB|nr:tryptophan-rich sensory protein [Paracoccus stylophorae]WCR10660.1 tryptophan-rich sensory protein [Paracoccus stylophorae]